MIKKGRKHCLRGESSPPHHSLTKERIHSCGHDGKFHEWEPNKFLLIRIVKMKPVQLFLHTGWKTTPWKEAELAAGIQFRGRKLRLRLHHHLGKEFTVERIVPRLDPASGALWNLRNYKYGRIAAERAVRVGVAVHHGQLVIVSLSR